MNQRFTWLQPEQRGPAQETWKRLWGVALDTLELIDPQCSTALRHRHHHRHYHHHRTVRHHHYAINGQPPLIRTDMSLRMASVTQNGKVPVDQQNGVYLVDAGRSDGTSSGGTATPVGTLDSGGGVPGTQGNESSSANADESTSCGSPPITSAISSTTTASTAAGDSNNGPPTPAINQTPAQMQTIDGGYPEESLDTRRKRNFERNLARIFDLDANRQELVSHYGGAPWICGEDQRPMYESGGAMGLHDEILNFYRWMAPNEAEFRIRANLYERVVRVINGCYPGIGVDYFGSFKTGLYLPTSDIDVAVLRDNSGEEVLSRMMGTIADALIDLGIATPDGVMLIESAAVPVIKMIDRTTEIRVDITFNTTENSVQSAELVKHYLDYFPPLRFLVVVLKQFLVQRDLHDTYTGGIGSYSLILMAVRFLQERVPMSLMAPDPLRCNLGDLLIQFLEVYGRKFNYINVGIRIKEGGRYMEKSELLTEMDYPHRSSMLCIEDPLTKGNDIGRSSHGVMKAKEAFDTAYLALRQAVLTPSDVYQHMYLECGSVLARIIRITDDVVTYRDRLRNQYAYSVAQQQQASHVTMTSPHMPMTSPHMTLTSPHMTMTSPHMTMTSPHITMTSPLMTTTPPFVTTPDGGPMMMLPSQMVDSFSVVYEENQMSTA